MMIENCTIVSITPPPTTTSDGDQVEADAAACGLRGFIDEPRRAQLLAMANKVSDASAVLMAPIALAGQMIAQGRVIVSVDEIGVKPAMRILHVSERVKAGGLSHVEVYLKGL